MKARQREPSSQQHPKSNEHPSSPPPRAGDSSTTINTLPPNQQGRTEQVARAPFPAAVTKTSHACAHHLGGRTTLPQTSPSSQRPRSGAPKQPARHDDSARPARQLHQRSHAPGGPLITHPPDETSRASPGRLQRQTRNLQMHLCGIISCGSAVDLSGSRSVTHSALRRVLASGNATGTGRVFEVRCGIASAHSGEDARGSLATD